MTNTKFTLNGQEWEVFDAEYALENSAKALIETGKDPYYYSARKVLKTGKKSVQCGTFFRFSKSGNYIRVL